MKGREILKNNFSQNISQILLNLFLQCYSRNVRIGSKKKKNCQIMQNGSLREEWISARPIGENGNLLTSIAKE